MVTFTILTNYNFIMNKSTFILGVFLLSFLSIEAQDYLEMMNSNQYTVLEVQNAAQVTIKIYNTLGKLVFYEKNRDLSQNPEIELQAPKGIYFLKVNSLSQGITKKLIIN